MSQDTVVKNIKLSIIGEKDGIKLRKLEENYEDLFGQKIPFRELGFRNVRELLVANSKQFVLRQGPDGERVEGTFDAATAHITKLVSGQKTSKKASMVRGKIPYKKSNFQFTTPPRFLQNRGRGRGGGGGGYRGGGAPRGPRPTVTYFPPPRFADRMTARRVVVSENTFDDYEVPGDYRISRPGASPAQQSYQQPKVQNGYIPPPFVPPEPSVARPRFRPPQPTPQVQPSSPIPKFNPSDAQEAITTRHRVERLAAERGLPCTVDIIAAMGSGYTALVKLGGKKFGSFGVFNTQFLAQEAAFENALLDLSRESPPMRETDNQQLVVDRVEKIVHGHTTGLFSNRVEDIYIEKYSEVLPEDWTELVRGYLSTECIGNKIIVYPIDLKDTILSKTNEAALLQEMGRCPSPLLLPDSPDLVVSVTSVVSPSEVYARIVEVLTAGQTCYGDKYDYLLDDMNTFYEEDRNRRQLAQTDVAGALCAAFVDEVWQRVQIIKKTGSEKEATCFLVDVGDMETIHLKDLINLPEQFRELPFQAIQCSLKGLEPFANDPIAIRRVQASDIVGNTVLIRVEGKRTNPNNGKLVVDITMLVDDGAEKINVNESVQEEIIEIISSHPAPLLNEVLLVTVTGATDENFIFCHHPEVIERIEMFMESLNSYKGLPIEANNNLDPSETLIIRTDDGKWKRARFLSNCTSIDFVQVQLLDYGLIVVVPRHEIRSLTNILPKLCRVPQAFRCMLPDVSRVESFAHKVMTWVGDSKVYLKVKTSLLTPEETLVAEISKRLPSGDVVHLSSHFNYFEYDIIDNVLNSKPQPRRVVAYSPSVSPLLANAPAPFTVPEMYYGRPPSAPRPPSVKQVITIHGVEIAPHLMPQEKLVDVYVTLVESPGKFWIHWYDEKKQIEDMLYRMNEHYTTEELLLVGRELQVENVEEGKGYAYRYDGSWYRVVVKRLHGQTFSGLIADYGDYITGPTSALRSLVQEFQTDPAFAVSAALYGVTPLGRLWSEAENETFDLLVKNRAFVAKVMATNVTDPRLVVKLIDTVSYENLDINVEDEFRKKRDELAV